MTSRSHPVRQLCDHWAHGAQLEAADLAEIRARLVDGVDRNDVDRRIRLAARLIAAERADGTRGGARRLAAELAREIIAVTGDLAPEPRDYPDDPRALAALVRR